MATLLFVFIFIIYIGLGIPDSTIGSAWPAIQSNLNLPISYASFITMIISSFTVIASFFSARIINRFGTGIVTAFSTLLSALALLGFSLSSSMLCFCLLSIPLGLGAGAIDSALNSYVAVRYKAIHMSFLHCFYGVGVALSPFVFSFALKLNENWRLGYKLVFAIQMLLVLIAFLSLPLWNKIKKREITTGEAIKPITLSYVQMAKTPAISIGWLVFFLACGIEFTCDTWASSFFVKSLDQASDFGATMLTLYFVGMTLGRFASGIISIKLSNKKIIFSGYCLMALGITMLFLPIQPILRGVGLFLIGFGNGPIFPNLSYLTPIMFGKQYSQSIMSSQMAVSNLGILILPPVFGVLAQAISIDLFPFFVGGMFVLLVLCTFLYFKKSKNTTIAIEN